MATTAHCCRMCGATSYRRVIDRDVHGALRPTSLYQCSGCSVVFADPKSWREGERDLPSPSTPADNPRPLMPIGTGIPYTPEFGAGVRLSARQPVEGRQQHLVSDG